MTKKDLNKMKKVFKTDSTLLNIKEIYCVYIKKDNNSVIYSRLDYFEKIDNETQELYLNSFKKILGGSLDTKLFQLKFNNLGEVNESKLLFNNMLNSSTSEEFKGYGDAAANSIIAKCSYDCDVVITFIRGEYWLSNLKSNKDKDENMEEDIIHSFNFIMGSINKVEPAKKTLMFNFESKELTPTSAVDSYININAPIDGFMFPCIESKFSDVNKLMYYCSKPKELNYKLIEEVLGCSMKLTADEEKNVFLELVKNAIGESVAADVIESVYSGVSEIKEMIVDEEEENLSLGAIKNLLDGINANHIEVFEKTYEESLGKDYSFNINNILPDFKSKSLKIWNDDINININPKNLSSVKQVKNEQGLKTLVIELKEDVLVEGFVLKTEE